jgi:formylmethanofuran dehydrogenase subunit B
LPHRIAGRVVDFQTAITKAEDLLAQSRAPLICGLDGLCIESQRAAFRLADRLRATVDTRLCDSGRGEIYSLQRVGRVTATLGEGGLCVVLVL